MRIILLCIVGLLYGGQLSAQNSLATAEQLTEDYRYEASSAILQAYIANHPARRYDLSRAWSLLSYNFLREGYLDKARQANDISRQLRMDLRSQELGDNALRLAQIELKTGNVTAALAAAEQGLQMIIEDTERYVDLNMLAARAHAALGAYDRRDAHLLTAAEVIRIELGACQPKVGRTYLAIARLYFVSGAYQEAEEWYALAYTCTDDILVRAEARIYAALSQRLLSHN